MGICTHTHTNISDFHVRLTTTISSHKHNKCTHSSTHRHTDTHTHWHAHTHTDGHRHITLARRGATLISWSWPVNGHYTYNCTQYTHTHTRQGAHTHTTRFTLHITYTQRGTKRAVALLIMCSERFGFAWAADCLGPANIIELIRVLAKWKPRHVRHAGHSGQGASGIYSLIYTYLLMNIDILQTIWASLLKLLSSSLKGQRQTQRQLKADSPNEVRALSLIFAYYAYAMWNERGVSSGGRR